MSATLSRNNNCSSTTTPKGLDVGQNDQTSTLSRNAPLPVATPGSPQAEAGATAPSIPIAASRTLTHQDKDDSKPQNVQIQLQYLASDPLYNSVKPIQIVPSFLDREGRSNIRLAPGQPETLNDVRGRFNDFSLDDNGFQYVHAPSTFTHWSSQPAIGSVYLKEMEELLKREVPGCDEILFYDARIRQESDEGVRVEGLSYNPFARQVHVDNTETSVVEKIRSMTEMKADYLLQGRARIINIWRPIKHPVYDCGLCVADGGKLTKDDVKECDRVRRDTGEYWDTMGVIQYRPGYEWYYMSHHPPEAVLLFKNYDSASDVRAKHCLHSAFDLPAHLIPAGAPTRESIEVRALLFTHPRHRRFSAGTLAQGTARLEHPLAVSLQKGDLKRVDDDHSIVDRVRKDIDEASEVKDAELLLRKRRIRELEGNVEALLAERDGARAELDGAEQQVRILQASNESLLAKVELLERQGGQPEAKLQHEVTSLSQHLASARLEQGSGAKDASDGLAGVCGATQADAEKRLLLEQLERQRQETQRWKQDAHGKGAQAVSRCWQASVDEAVRREREKDAGVIRQLREEMEWLKEARM